MANVKISSKGKALLKTKASAKVAQAIVQGGNQLSAASGIAVKVNGKTITIKGTGM